LAARPLAAGWLASRTPPLLLVVSTSNKKKPEICQCHLQKTKNINAIHQLIGSTTHRIGTMHADT
jgi:hypothetical protein